MTPRQTVRKCFGNIIKWLRMCWKKAQGFLQNIVNYKYMLNASAMLIAPKERLGRAACRARGVSISEKKAKELSEVFTNRAGVASATGNDQPTGLEVGRGAIKPSEVLPASAAEQREKWFGNSSALKSSEVEDKRRCLGLRRMQAVI